MKVFIQIFIAITLIIFFSDKLLAKDFNDAIWRNDEFNTTIYIKCDTNTCFVEIFGVSGLHVCQYTGETGSNDFVTQIDNNLPVYFYNIIDDIGSFAVKLFFDYNDVTLVEFIDLNNPNNKYVASGFCGRANAFPIGEVFTKDINAPDEDFTDITWVNEDNNARITMKCYTDTCLIELFYRNTKSWNPCRLICDAWPLYVYRNFKNRKPIDITVINLNIGFNLVIDDIYLKIFTDDGLENYNNPNKNVFPSRLCANDVVFPINDLFIKRTTP